MAVTRGLLRPNGGEGSIRSFVVIVTLIAMIIFVYYKTKYPANEISKLDLHALNLKNTALHDNLKSCMEETEKMKAERDEEIKKNTFKEEIGIHDKEKYEKLVEENKKLMEQIADMKETMYECTSKRDQELKKAQECEVSIQKAKKKNAYLNRVLNNSQQKLDGRKISDDDNVEVTQTFESKNLSSQTTESKDDLNKNFDEKFTQDLGQKLNDTSDKINIDNESTDEFKKKIIGKSNDKSQSNSFNNNINKNNEQMTTEKDINPHDENVQQNKNSQSAKLEDKTLEQINKKRRDIGKNENQDTIEGNLNEHSRLLSEKEKRHRGNNVSEQSTLINDDNQVDRILFKYKVSNIKKNLRNLPQGNADNTKQWENNKKEHTKQEENLKPPEDNAQQGDSKQQNGNFKQSDYNKEQANLKHQMHMNKANASAKQLGYLKQSQENIEQYQHHKLSKLQYYKQGQDDSAKFQEGDTTKQHQESNNQNEEIIHDSNSFTQSPSKKPLMN